MRGLWFGVDCNIFTNAKVLRFAQLSSLDVDSAVGKLCRLYGWAVQSGNESGDISHLPPRELAAIMRWHKDPKPLLDRLISSGLLERRNGLFIHHWSELNGSFLAKSRKDRERKARGTAPAPPHFRGNSAPTVPYLTVPTPSPSENGCFVPPALQEVADFVRERRSNVNPQGFIDFYQSKGWTIGNSPMRDWKAACRNAEHWERWKSSQPASPKCQQSSFADIANILEQEGSL